MDFMKNKYFIVKNQENLKKCAHVKNYNLMSINLSIAAMRKFYNCNHFFLFMLCS